MRFVVLSILAVGALAAAPAAAADGAALYAENCAKCHGEDGKAQTAVGKAMKVPPLHAGQLPAEKLVEFLRGNGKHKSLAAKLSDEELTAIANALPSGS